MSGTNPAAPTPAPDGDVIGVPVDGDVLVTPDPHASGRHWISRVPRLPLMVAGAQIDAIRLAREMAREGGVGLWYGDYDHYWRLETEASSAGARPPDGRTHDHSS
jgi:hypothetical protein